MNREITIHQCRPVLSAAEVDPNWILVSWILSPPTEPEKPKIEEAKEVSLAEESIRPYLHPIDTQKKSSDKKAWRTRPQEKVSTLSSYY